MSLSELPVFTDSWGMEMNSSQSPAVTEETLVDKGPTPVMDDVTREFAIQVIMFLMLPLNIMGVITNIINIRVFLEQGVKDDSTNIGFLSLSIFDFFGCLFLIPYNFCYVVVFTLGNEHYTCSAYATIFLYAHIVFQHSCAWTTVYISVVRTACVVVPLKVKLLFRPKMTKVIIVSIFTFFSVNEILYCVFTRMEWIFIPGLNTTVAVMVGSEISQWYLYHNSIFTNQVLSVAALIIVSITTSLLRYKLIQVRKWREKTMNVSGKEGAKGDHSQKPLASKDIELIKSVTAVTVIFLVCLLMSFIPSSAIVFLPGVNFSGINRNLFLTVYMIRFYFDSVNSSINFFFYIRVSSRYKEAFAASFHHCASGSTT